MGFAVFKYIFSMGLDKQFLMWYEGDRMKKIWQTIRLLAGKQAIQRKNVPTTSKEWETLTEFGRGQLNELREKGLPIQLVTL